KDIKGKKSKNKQKPTRNEETSDHEEIYQSRISPTQEKKVNKDPIEVKGSIMTSFQKSKDQRCQS
ncbi:hypothetical protein Tco_0786776, partial [Tanacetum coccineum]